VAAGAATLGVENGAIRYVGDSGPNELDPFPVENGEQAFYAEGVTLGPGCRARPPDPGPTNSPRGNVLCSRDGVTRIEFVGGDGPDVFFPADITAVDLPIVADMGPGNDRFDLGGTAPDDIQLGDGDDIEIDGLGDDRVDGGPGNDTVAGGDFSVGNDTIAGGEGDDNLDGYAGNDTADGGAGNDIMQPSEGDDTVYGGAGDDYLSGVGGSCSSDPGNDSLSGGPGNDGLCGGSGVDTLDGGDGDDSVSSLDFEVDGPVSCGAGNDAVWSDAFDPVSLDCEQQGDQRTLKLAASNVLPVPLPCPAACAGKLSVFATPTAPRPQVGGRPPLAPPKAAGKALARTRFTLKSRSRRTLRLHLDRRAAKRVRRLGATTIEARTTFTQAGKSYAVRHTFGLATK
jgi:Ca2+-binding RTX toxin-like protein